MRSGAELSLFEARYGGLAPASAPPLARLHDLAARFAAFPYESLSKVVAYLEAGGRPSPRLPARVMADHLSLGAGGTCFSLTELFRCLALAAGLEAHPVLCRTRRGDADHCALVAWAGGRPHLVDPGYLLERPLPLAGAGAVEGERGEPLLVAAGSLDPRFGAPPLERPGELDLFTHEDEGPRWRYRVQTRPPTEAEFRARWLQSFEGLGRKKIVATRRLPGGGVLYLHGHKLRRSGATGHTTRNVRASLADAAREGFGISPVLTERALALLEAAAAASRGRDGDRPTGAGAR
jgi:arylamine N-acetyltransferase